MPQVANALHTQESTGCAWPDRTHAVSYVGTACVVQGSDDFDTADLDQVRRLFPGRRVTLDGDVITVWPSAGQGCEPPCASSAVL